MAEDKKHICKYCQEEFENQGYLLRHYQDCWLKPENVDKMYPTDAEDKEQEVTVSTQGTEEEAADTMEVVECNPVGFPPIIPKSKCPEELTYLSVGKVVALRVTGKLQADGSVRIEGVEYIR